MKNTHTITLLFSLAFTPFIVTADTLSELKQTLNLLNNTSPISATLTTTNFYQQGEGKDKVIRNGNAAVNISDSSKGLQVIYSSEILSKLEAEASERVKNENAETPTLNVINSNGATKIKSILSAAPSILRTITQAKFTNEETVNINGKNLQQLNFTLPVSAIISDKRTREYVKKFDSQYSVIIDENGIPLSTTLNFSGKGRAYIVLSVKASGFEQSHYKVINQRLVRVSNESGSSFDSTFGYSQRKSNEVLTIINNQEDSLLAHLN